MNDEKETPRPRRRVLLWIAIAVLACIAAVAIWFFFPQKGASPADFLPAASFGYIAYPLDRSDPGVQALVSALKAKLAGPGTGFARRTLVGMLLPAALPASVAVAFAEDPGAGEPTLLIFADMGRWGRVLRLFGGRLDGMLLKDGPVVKYSAAGRRVAYVAGKSGGLRPSAYAVAGGMLIMAGGIDALDACLEAGVQASGLSADLRSALAGKAAVLRVDNAGGGMTRMVNAASEKYAFAAFPSMDAVTAISGEIRLLPRSAAGKLTFDCPAGARIPDVESDVRFISGAVKRVARAAGAGMEAEVSTAPAAVTFSFDISDYLKIVEGEKE